MTYIKIIMLLHIIDMNLHIIDRKKFPFKYEEIPLFIIFLYIMKHWTIGVTTDGGISQDIQ